MWLAQSWGLVKVLDDPVFDGGVLAVYIQGAAAAPEIAKTQAQFGPEPIFIAVAQP